MKFNNVGIIVKPVREAVGKTAEQVNTFLLEKGCTVYLDASTDGIIEQNAGEMVSREQIGERCELVIVIGGDGTFLNAARSLAISDVSLVGINIGRLGFLVDVPPDDINTSLEQIFAGEFSKEERFLLNAEVHRDHEVIFSADALNDVVVHIRDVARMMEFETRINGSFVNHQRADGLIISTPTGSTAYALSSGGPLLHPSLNVMVLVPISPHTLSDRPIVIDSDAEVDVLIYETKQATAQITCDGHTSYDVIVGDHVKVKRQSYLITLLHPPGHDHFHTLREKLHWSEHP